MKKMLQRRTRNSLLLLAICLACTGALANTGTVTAVRAGDLVVIGEDWTTRLTGIVAPGPDTPIGGYALEFTRRQLEGKLVKFFTYTADNTAAGIVRDGDGRPFAVIKCGPDLTTDVGALLLEKGLARIDEAYLPEDLGHYREIEARARERKIGIWAQAE
jgi:endonuclease YncB( thermonuclease family)